MYILIIGVIYSRYMIFLIKLINLIFYIVIYNFCSGNDRNVKSIIISKINLKKYVFTYTIYM